MIKMHKAQIIAPRRTAPSYYFMHTNVLSVSEIKIASHLDVCLVIDSTGSIKDMNPPDQSYDNWMLQLEFLAQLVDLFTIGPLETRVGAVVFAGFARLIFTLITHTDVQSVNNALLGLTYYGGLTNTEEAFRVAREECFNVTNGERSNVPNLIIFISDGEPFPPSSRDAAIAESESLRKAGVMIFSTGVTDMIGEQFLKSVSTPSQSQMQNYFMTANFTSLAKNTATVAEGICELIGGLLTHIFIVSTFPLFMQNFSAIVIM